MCMPSYGHLLCTRVSKVTGSTCNMCINIRDPTGALVPEIRDPETFKARKQWKHGAVFQCQRSSGGSGATLGRVGFLKTTGEQFQGHIDLSSNTQVRILSKLVHWAGPGNHPVCTGHTFGFIAAFHVQGRPGKHLSLCRSGWRPPLGPLPIYDFAQDLGCLCSQVQWLPQLQSSDSKPYPLQARQPNWAPWFWLQSFLENQLLQRSLALHPVLSSLGEQFSPSVPGKLPRKKGMEI